MIALGGGFSGAQVSAPDFEVFVQLGATHNSVLKIGPRGEIAQEKFGNEVVKNVLADTVPRVLLYQEGPLLAAFEMELASEVRTFQQCLAVEDVDFCLHIMDSCLKHQMSRLYHASSLDSIDLLTEYQFTNNLCQPRHGESAIKAARRLSSAHLDLEPIVDFYANWLSGKCYVVEALTCFVHADLNLANILVQKEPLRTYVIDFARLQRVPNVLDFAKIEACSC